MAILFDDGSIVFDDGGIVFADDPEECDCCGEQVGEPCPPNCLNEISTGRVRITVTGVTNLAEATFCDELHACDNWNDTYILPDDYLPDPFSVSCASGQGDIYECPDDTVCDTGGVRHARTHIIWGLLGPSGGDGYRVFVTLGQSSCTLFAGNWVPGAGQSATYEIDLGETRPNCISGIYVLDYVADGGSGTATCDFSTGSVTLEFIP